MKKTKVVVACNDAGGAEIVAAYIKKNQAVFSFVCYVAGPAEKIFAREKIVFERAPENAEAIDALLNLHCDAGLVLTGTGWMTKIEQNFIIVGKSIGIRTAAYLEHWVNYRERFGFPKVGWEKNIPDEIWVGDEYARELALKYFQTAKIVCVKNQYWENIKIRYRDFCGKDDDQKDILFLSEPTSYDQFVMKGVLDFLFSSRFCGRCIVRFHPAEMSDKYDALFVKYPSLSIEKSSAGDIVEDIARACLVIGMESMALVAAVVCNKKTISYISDKNIPFPLPFKEIIRINSVEEFENLARKGIIRV